MYYYIFIKTYIINKNKNNKINILLFYLIQVIRLNYLITLYNYSI